MLVSNGLRFYATLYWIFTLFYCKRIIQHTHAGVNKYMCTRVVYMRVYVHTRMCVYMGTRMDLLICAYMCLCRRVRVRHLYLTFQPVLSISLYHSHCSLCCYIVMYFDVVHL